jgi:hypothetical protein
VISTGLKWSEKRVLQPPFRFTIHHRLGFEDIERDWQFAPTKFGDTEFALPEESGIHKVVIRHLPQTTLLLDSVNEIKKSGG